MNTFFLIFNYVYDLRNVMLVVEGYIWGKWIDYGNVS